MRVPRQLVLLGLVAAACAAPPNALQKPPATSQLTGLNGWSATPILTVGDSLPSTDPRFSAGYRPIGVLDGIGALSGADGKSVRVLVNHEVSEDEGYAYPLANGTELTGARISYFDIDAATREIVDGGLAYGAVFDRAGAPVTDPEQVNEDGETSDGIARFCSAQLVTAGAFGFVDTIFFAHEEASDPEYHPHGGSLWALDVEGRALHAVPAAGRMAWENSAAMDAGSGRVALLIGDDTAPQTRDDPIIPADGRTLPEDTVAAPLWLYVGQKNASEEATRAALPFGIAPANEDFLNRNGLLVGTLYFFVADNPQVLDVRHFHGAGHAISGHWRAIDVRDGTRAAEPGHDGLGYKNGFTLRREAKDAGAFQFSRPEDVSTDPRNPRRAVVASTGRGRAFDGHDKWGAIYLVEIDFDRLRKPGSTTIRILYDGDEPANRDHGIRNPDNLDWADDGFMYVQEDDAIKEEDTEFSAGGFGEESGEEASIWRLDPKTSEAVRIARIDRSAVLPKGATDDDPADIGDWESSGVLDVTGLFPTSPAESLLIASVQAHSVKDGAIAEQGLVQGGQLVLLSKP